jgi:argininosuccinate synthase
MERTVLAYAGGLDVAVALSRPRDAHAAGLIAVTMNLGWGSALEWTS